jgi:putative ABC transport system permease protein
VSHLSRLLYRLALLVLPEPIRAKHGAAMEALVERHVARARARGPIAGAVAVCAALFDAVRRGLYERLRRSPARNAPPSSMTRSTTHRPTPSSGEPFMSGLLYDFRFALRGLVRSPRFAILAVLTLALGIGANVSLFSVVHGVVLRPLPFPEPERVTHVAWDYGSGQSITIPAYRFEFWSERSRVFESTTTWRHTSMAGDAETGERLAVLRVSHEFLDVLGWEPALGRDFTEQDDVPGSSEVAIVGNDLWRTRFAGDPGILGRSIEIDGVPRTIVGVLPPEFDFPQEPEAGDALVPLRLVADPLDEGQNWPLLARIRDGVDRSAVRADLERVHAEFAAAHPELVDDFNRALTMASYQDLYVGGVADVLWVLMAATGLVLLIACANVAALVLARGSSRGGEMAVRAALGAGRGRIARYIVTEGLLLGGAACVLGLALAWVGVDALLGLYPGTLPRAEGIGLNASVVLYAVVAALVTGTACGLIAAVPALRGRVADALRESGRGGTGRGGVRRLVLAVEAAVSVVLLVGAGLLVATLVEIRRVDPGFEIDGLLAAELPMPAGGWESGGGVRQVEARVLEELSALPGVEQAAAASTYPLRRGWNIPVSIQRQPDLYEGAVEWRSVSDGYLEALGASLVRGRTFTRADAEGSPPVALVNEAFVERYFPGESAIGERIEIGRYDGRYIAPEFDVGGVEIVGVVSDVREIDLTVDPRRTVLVPAAQAPPMLQAPPVLVVRTRDGGSAAASAVRSVLAGVSGGGQLPEVRTMADVVGDSLAQERFNALLMAILAGVALLLTAFGIYGVVSYGVRQRRREIGIRVALGARRGTVARLVMGQGMVPVLLGLAVGVVGALGLTRFLEGLLWGVEPTDPVTIVLVALQLAAVAALSSWLPVREATRIDPNRSLRPE